MCSEFVGSFEEEYQQGFVPTWLKTLVSMILQGPKPNQSNEQH